MLFIFLAVMFGLLAAPAQGIEDPPRQLAEVIREFVYSKYPEWAGLEVNVEWRGADKTMEYLSRLKGPAEVEILQVIDSFKPVGNVIFPIRVSSRAGEEKFFVRAKVEVVKPVAVAKYYIPRGAVITADDVEMGKRDIALLPPNYLDKVDYVVGNEAKTAISAKSTIFSWMFKAVPQVRPGDPVTIRVLAPDLMVRTQGIALSDGYIGETLKVRRKDSNSTLDGILVSAGLVEVKLR